VAAVRGGGRCVAVDIAACGFAESRYDNKTKKKEISVWKYIIRNYALCTSLSEMGGACSTYGGKERCIQEFGGET
jgi:hypothetical protein